MTSHFSEPAPPGTGQALFGATACDYARYRPGIPDAAVRLLAAALHGVPAPTLPDLYPEAGPTWQARVLYLAAYPAAASAPLAALLAGAGKRLWTVPDEMINAAVDIREHIDRKWAAILAHRSEAVRGRSLPALLSQLPATEREVLLGTECFIRRDLLSPHKDLHQLQC
ncbi:hypothetical protein ACODT5_01050 [Streptomyces sp. 5.8]|uniref:hypothetical protein n=1 Tax=Streptomyces sp. 5.8 TaxID=3406571 RepID=UPI003BB7931B